MKEYLIIQFIIILAGGSSSNACSETHAGSSAFSEIETKSLSEYLKSISDKFFAYISFHSYSQLLLFPYGHTKDHLENYNDLVRELFLFFYRTRLQRKIMIRRLVHQWNYVSFLFFDFLIFLFSYFFYHSWRSVKSR